MKYLQCLFFGLLIFGFLIVPVSCVDLERPIDYWVPGDYATIQEAIDEAPAGAVIGLSRDTETTAFTIDFDRPMVIRGDGTGGVTTVRLANTVGDYDYVFEITADHCGLQNLIIEEAHYGTEAGIRVEGDYCAVNEITMTGFDEIGIWAAYADSLEVSYCDLSLTGSISDGVKLHTCEDAEIIGNTISTPGNSGIDLAFCDDAVIESNDISNCEYGVYAYFSHWLDMKTNDIHENDGGTVLSYCFYGDVHHNTFDLNNGYGIQLWNGASDNTVRDNTITNNLGSGVEIDKYSATTENNEVKRNLIQDNAIGCRLDLSDSNYVYLNNFIDNTDQTDRYSIYYQSPTVRLYEYDGTQYTGYLGNYWSDYAGVDVSPVDGIGDTTYTDGLNDIDYYPLIAHESFYTLIPSYPLQLSSGWNLVSFPYIPADPSVGAVMSGVSGYTVKAWDGSSYIVPDSFEAGRGYWIKVPSDETLMLTGTEVTSVTLDLETGYNVVGGPNSIVQASDVLSGFYIVAAWTPSGYSSSLVFEPGEGYLVFVLSYQSVTLP